MKRKVTIYFRNNTSAEYTTDVLPYCIGDNTINCIIDSITGEVIFDNIGRYIAPDYEKYFKQNKIDVISLFKNAITI